MSLVVVVVILFVWAGYGIWNALTPPAPPIDDLDAHLKQVQSIGNQKDRQKYLRNRSKK